VFYADADLDADSRDTGQPLCLADDSDEQLAAGLDMAKVQAGDKARGVAPSPNDEQPHGHRPDEGEDGRRHGQPAPKLSSRRPYCRSLKPFRARVVIPQPLDELWNDPAEQEGEHAIGCN
jgi:hypothetical protein